MNHVHFNMHEDTITTNVHLENINVNDLLNLLRNISSFIANQSETLIQAENIDLEKVPIISDKRLIGLSADELINLIIGMNLSIRKVWQKIDELIQA